METSGQTWLAGEPSHDRLHLQGGGRSLVVAEVDKEPQALVDQCHRAVDVAELGDDHALVAERSRQSAAVLTFAADVGALLVIVGSSLQVAFTLGDESQGG